MDSMSSFTKKETDSILTRAAFESFFLQVHSLESVNCFNSIT